LGTGLFPGFGGPGGSGGLIGSSLTRRMIAE
jgi:hypothetical protein